MSCQDNPFALLEDDDEGADISVLLAKVEAKIPVVLPVVAEQSKQKVHELPSKHPTPTDYAREVRGRGRGGRGRGTGRGGFDNVGGIEAIEKPYNGYSGESGGERSRGRGSRRGLGRARAVTGFVNRNHLDFDNLGGLSEEGAESKDKTLYEEKLSSRYDRRKFAEGKNEKDGEGREHSGFREYDGRENGRFQGYGTVPENRAFRDGDGHGEMGFGGDRENHRFRFGVGYEGKSYGGFRGVEGRGKVYGARGTRGTRGRHDSEHGGTHYDSNERWSASETKGITFDVKDPIANNTSNENDSFRSIDPSAAEEPNSGQLDKSMPEQISAEDTSKVLEEDKEMTLAEYEKLLQEKRKALESLKIQTRKLVIDKDFEGMQVIEKKKELDLIKMRSDNNDKGKKKEISEREEKSRKSLSINEFLKPADGERYRGPAASRGRGGRGRGRGVYTSDYTSQAAAPPLEDPSHFPILRPLAKA